MDHKLKTWEELTEMKREMAVPVKYTMADLNSIVVTFWEGGSDYWVEKRVIDHPAGVRPRGTPSSEWAFDALLHNGRVSITPDDDEEAYELTLDKLKAGLLKFLRHYNAHYPVVVGGEIEAGNIDADYADSILQYALFDKLVYG